MMTVTAETKDQKSHANQITTDILKPFYRAFFMRLNQADDFTLALIEP